MQASTNLLNDITANDRKPFNYNSLNSNKNSLVASMSFTVGAWASTAVNRNLKHQKNSSNLAKNNSGEKFCHFRSSEFFHFTEIFRFCSHRVSSRNEFWISRQRLFSKINSSIIFFSELEPEKSQLRTDYTNRLVCTRMDALDYRVKPRDLGFHVASNWVWPDDHHLCWPPR